MVEAILGVLVALAAVAFRLAGPDRTVAVELWQYVTYSGAAFLGIGLVRDLVVRFVVRPKGAPTRSGEKLICFESLAGAGLVACGLGLLALEVERAFHPAVSSLGIAAGALLALSGATKDVVLVFKREKNHANVIPW